MEPVSVIFLHTAYVHCVLARAVLVVVCYHFVLTRVTLFALLLVPACASPCLLLRARACLWTWVLRLEALEVSIPKSSWRPYLHHPATSSGR